MNALFSFKIFFSRPRLEQAGLLQGPEPAGRVRDHARRRARRHRGRLPEVRGRHQGALQSHAGTGKDVEFDSIYSVYDGRVCAMP